MNELFRLVGLVVIKNDEAKKGLDDTVSHAEKSQGKLGSVMKTIAKVGVAGATAVATAIGAVTKKAIANYAEYEQLVGGVETLFKDSSDQVLRYAQNAYKTAGLSANQYMQTVTSFTASLLQGLNGDTAKTAKVADMAITDMADNANKMGTSMEMIQNAYQGFSKQNYMMLDNLKLGYGGTKTEMERLLADAEKLTGIHYDISNLADVYEAIHVIQTELGITGTTAKEAQSTIQGSFLMMKASWENLMTGLADPTQNLDVLMGNVIDSVVAFLNNLIPRIAMTIPRVISGIGTLISTIGSALPSMLGQLVPVVIDGAKAVVNGFMNTMATIGDNLGTITGKISSFMSSMGNAIKANLPLVVDKALDVIQGFATSFANNLPTIVSSGIELLRNLVQGIMNSLPSLIAKVPTIINTFCGALNTMFPQLIMGGMKILMDIAVGLVRAIPSLIANIPQIILAIVNALTTFSWFKLGGKVVTGIKDGIKSGVTGIKEVGKSISKGIDDVISKGWDAIKTKTSSAWQSVKDFILKPLRDANTTVGSIVNKIKSIASSAWNSIKGTATSVWNSIKSAITNPIEKARSTVQGLINKIKGYFKFRWSLPKLKLPHVKISGKFSLVPPSAPKFGISWYKDGGIMTKPTMFGYNALTNMAHVGGEAGDEAIAPIDLLLEYVKTAVSEENRGLAESIERLIEMLALFLPQIVAGMNRDIVLDSGALVGQLGGQFDTELGRLNKLKGRGI